MAALCFVLSGAAGLLYEVVWSKQIAYLLGNSLHSVAVVVAAFLGGLALGARFLGGPLTRSGDPGRRYAMLELAVAGAGLLILPLLRAIDPVVGQLYRSLGGEGAAFAIARVVLVFALLVPPAALMGATLPVLVARCERGALGAGLAWLYALNTLGAVAGSLLGGFLLLPEWGLTRSTFAAALLNLVAAAVARGAPARSGPSIASRCGVVVAPAACLPAAARRVLGAVFALLGSAAPPCCSWHGCALRARPRLHRCTRSRPCWGCTSRGSRSAVRGLRLARNGCAARGCWHWRSS